MLARRLEKYLTAEERQRMREQRELGRIEGRIEGLSQAVLLILRIREVPYPQELMARLLTQSEPELRTVIGRAVSVQRAEELFD